MKQWTIHRFPMSSATLFFLVWLTWWVCLKDVSWFDLHCGLFNVRGHWLPLSSDFFLFPYNFFWKQPMALCPAWPQIKQWEQVMLPFSTHSLHLPLVSVTGGWGRLGVTGPPDFTFSVVLTIWARCLVKEDTYAVSSLMASTLVWFVLILYGFIVPVNTQRNTRVSVLLRPTPVEYCVAGSEDAMVSRVIYRLQRHLQTWQCTNTL